MYVSLPQQDNGMTWPIEQRSVSMYSHGRYICYLTNAHKEVFYVNDEDINLSHKFYCIVGVP